MKVRGYKYDFVECEVTEDEVFVNLFKKYFHYEPKDLTIIFDEDGVEGVYVEIDESVHGSPVYKEKLITDDKKMVKFYKHLNDAYYAFLALKK